MSRTITGDNQECVSGFQTLTLPDDESVCVRYGKRKKLVHRHQTILYYCSVVASNHLATVGQVAPDLIDYSRYCPNCDFGQRFVVSQN